MSPLTQNPHRAEDRESDLRILPAEATAIQPIAHPTLDFRFNFVRQGANAQCRIRVFRKRGLHQPLLSVVITEMAGAPFLRECLAEIATGVKQQYLARTRPGAIVWFEHHVNTSASWSLEQVRWIQMPADAKGAYGGPGRETVSIKALELLAGGKVEL